jgi:hypothetical protein
MKLTNKDFRLSKSTKRMLCNFRDKNLRAAWKKIMIEAEVAAKKAKLSKLPKEKGDE